jgi:hypothetical protein
MKIDRSNYEIWFIDWLDGNLNEIQVEQLHQFLMENPDLKEEFDDLSIVRVNPSEKSFSNKNLLRKSIDDLSETQFEYLCTAYMENDLSDDQKIELKESIQHNKEREKTFESIGKMKLSPIVVSYKHKNRLYRRTVGQNVKRLSLIGLSAAAIIALIIMTYFTFPRQLPGKSETTAQSAYINRINTKSAVEKTNRKITFGENIISTKKPVKHAVDKPAAAKKINALSEQPDIENKINHDSPAISADYSQNRPGKIPVPADIDLPKVTIPNTLAANSIPVIPIDDDSQPRLSKLIAKTFREKILKEKAPKDNPLKVYEIAEAGVSGLNKIFGWEMSIDEKNDNKGELKSVYFSSKILKFNAPVKKSEPLQ